MDEGKDHLHQSTDDTEREEKTKEINGMRTVKQLECISMIRSSDLEMQLHGSRREMPVDWGSIVSGRS